MPPNSAHMLMQGKVRSMTFQKLRDCLPAPISRRDRPEQRTSCEFVYSNVWV
jgi:hypothetical protein